MDRNHLSLTEIWATLDQILVSSPFRRSPNLQSFLRFVAEESLAGRGSSLKAYTIAVEALGRSPDFDPATDAIVRVEGRRLRDALARLYADPGCALPVRVELAVGRYEPSFRRNRPGIGQDEAARRHDMGEDRHRSLVDLTGGIEWRTDASGAATIGFGWSARTGQSEEDFRGGGWLAMLHPDDREQVARTWVAARAAGEAVQVSYRLRHRDGAYRWMLSRGAPLEVGGAVREWVGLVLDMHEQVLLEEARRSSEDRMRLAMEAAALVVWEVDLATREVTRSDNARAVFGFDPPAGLELLDLFHPADADRVRAALEAAMASDVLFNERFRLIVPDGRTLTLVGRGQRRRDHEGRWRFVGVTAVVENRSRPEDGPVTSALRDRGYARDRVG